MYDFAGDSGGFGGLTLNGTDNAAVAPTLRVPGLSFKRVLESFMVPTPIDLLSLDVYAVPWLHARPLPD